MSGRSTAGDDDDDCIWYECNLPFRVNIPFPISMKHNFQPFAGNISPQLYKSLVPAGKLHQNRSIQMPRPSEFLMQRALPAPNPEDSSSISKAIAFTKKKGLKRGRKLCTFETSTQTIEEESDPVLCCLEQIRIQLAAKFSNGEEKKTCRYFAEKSTNVRSIQRLENEADEEMIKTCRSKESLKLQTEIDDKSEKSDIKLEPKLDDKTEKLDLKLEPKIPIVSSPKSSQKSVSINTLPPPPPELIKLKRKKKKSSKILSESNPESSKFSLVGKISNSDKSMLSEDLRKAKDADKKDNLFSDPKPVSVLPGSIYRSHFRYGCHMPRWQYYGPPQCCQYCSQYIQMQNQMFNKTKPKEAADGIKSRSTDSVQGKKLKPEIISQKKTESSHQRQENIGSDETLSASSKIFRKSSENISSSIRHSSKSFKSSEGSEIINSKTKKSYKGQIRKKLNQKQSHRITSGGSTNFTKKFNNDQRDYIPCRQNTEEAVDMSQHSNRLHNEQGSSSESFRTDQAITDIGECSSKTSEETKSFENYMSNSCGQKSENCEDQLNHMPPSSDADQVKYYNNQRSHSAPNGWMRRCTQNKNIPRSGNAHPCQPQKEPAHFSGKQNTESQKCPEQVLVLQDETCESESEDYERLGYNNYTTHNRMEKEDQDCRKFATPNYSINVDFLKQCRLQEGFLNFNQRQKIQQDQTGQNRPSLVMPLSQNKKDKWRELKAKLTMLVPHQLQMVPKTCEVSLQNALPCRDVHGQLEIPHPIKLEHDALPLSCSQLLITNRRDSNSSQQKISKLYKTAIIRKVILKNPKPNMFKSQGNGCIAVFRRSSRSITPTRLSDLKQSLLPCKGTKKINSKTSFDSGQQSSVSKLCVGERKESPRFLKQCNDLGSNTSIESRDSFKFKGSPSYTVLQVIQKDSKAFGVQLQEKQDKYNGNRRTNSENDETHTLYGQSGFRSDRSNQDSYQDLRRTRNLAIGKAEGYTPNQPNDASLTWTEPAGYSKLEVPLGDSSQTKSMARSNATLRSTDVETLETVTLMQPRKLSSTESARIEIPDTGIEKTFLMATRTPCDRENLLQTCGRPPCTHCPQRYTGLPPNLPQGFMISQPPDQPQTSRSAPQNRTPFSENYLIDPRDQWRTTKSPASAPVMQAQFQQPPMPTFSQNLQFQDPVYPPSPFYYPQALQENIQTLPEGFYDQTVNKYNITRMDSNFQPPSLRSEFLYALQSPQQYFLRPHSNQFPKQLVMGSVPDQNHPFIPPQNQLFQPQLQSQNMMFRPQQNVKLDEYLQSEYHI
ncbi:uncharacterized protein LOC108146582 [Drosophila elegans]|uniref:uncharacterized protein LOC108146582 n=1 Tax=Drosophila elegans TaxID=30023 RepID=UPI001BC8599A|nr:uncharacterized protein LOC108146582 [Drosophila elegans]